MVFVCMELSQVYVQHDSQDQAGTNGYAYLSNTTAVQTCDWLRKLLSCG